MRLDLWVILETMPGQDLIAQRLASQQLMQPGFRNPGDLVAYLGAVQAQDYTGAKWSLGVRLPGSTDRGIEQALIDREIVRTWMMRGTLFFVSPADVRWIVRLVGKRMIDSIQGRYRRLELDEKTLARSSELIVKALQDSQGLTRKELLSRLEKNGITTAGLRAPHILQRTSLEGLVCQTAALRNDPTYILMDSLPPQPESMRREEALAELARRYFTSHGPATLKDFAWWLGLPLADARIGLEGVQSQLIQADIEGQVYWHAQLKQPINSYTHIIHLCPAADEYLLGYQDRSPILDARHAQMLMQGNGLNPFILKGGRVVGTWRRTMAKKEVVVKGNGSGEIDSDDMQRLNEAARRYGDFIGLPARLSVDIQG